MKLEVVVIPVADADRAKEFYGKFGWRLDADFPAGNGFRVVQFTPPGSGCSVQFGTNITSAAPGSAKGTYLIVSGIEAAREELVALGVHVGEVFHAGAPGAQFQPDGTSTRVDGPARDGHTPRLTMIPPQTRSSPIRVASSIAASRAIREWRLRITFSHRSAKDDRGVRGPPGVDRICGEVASLLDGSIAGRESRRIGPYEFRSRPSKR